MTISLPKKARKSPRSRVQPVYKTFSQLKVKKEALNKTSKLEALKSTMAS
jgi:hypothetical protein